MGIFNKEPLDNDEETLRDCGIKHRDIILLIKPPKKEEKPKRKSYLPENWREEIDKKYGQVKTTTYRTNYSGDDDEGFLKGKIREEEVEFEFFEEVTKTSDK